MNKKELINAIARQAGLSKSDAKKVLDAILKAIFAAVSRGEKVNIPGLGTFSTKERAARKGRNPFTGEPMSFAARKRISFTVARSLKLAVTAGITKTMRSPETGEFAEFESPDPAGTAPKVGFVKPLSGPSDGEFDDFDYIEFAERSPDGSRERETKSTMVDSSGPFEATGSEPEPPPPAETDAEAAPEQPRFLQTQMEQKTRDGFTQIAVEDCLHPERQTRVNVRVGYQNERWTSLERSINVPDDSSEQRILGVYFWDKDLSPVPQHDTIRLPAKGNSSVVRFSFQADPQYAQLEARITVLYQGRVLQTGLLSAAFGEAPNGCQFKFREDAMPAPDLGRPGEQEAFDTALVFNHAGDGQPRAHSFIEDEYAVIDIREEALNDFTDTLNLFLSRVAHDPNEFSDISSEKSRELYRDLAQKGATLRKAVLGSNGVVEDIGMSRRLQIISTRDSYLPAEFLYDLAAPDDDASLCDGFAEALESGDCCGACNDNTDKNICAMGFWGLSRVIERHAHTPEHTQLDEGAFRFLVRNAEQRSPLHVLAGALLGASDRADSMDDQVVTRVHDTLSQLFAGHTVPNAIRSWNKWITGVCSEQRSLLVLLPHHDRRGGFEILEIGNDGLKADIIKKKHVMFDDESAPIVLLIGCETTQSKVSFDNFIRRFHEAGASIVVGTVSTILGRHAGPATELLVTEIVNAAQQQTTIGVALLNARRRLVRRGYPMSMGLSGYGGADWKLDTEET